MRQSTTPMQRLYTIAYVTQASIFLLECQKMPFLLGQKGERMSIFTRTIPNKSYRSYKIIKHITCLIVFC